MKVRKAFSVLWAASALGVAGGMMALPAAAQVTGDVVKIGVLTDMSSVYADNTGLGDVVATRMAIEDFGGKVLGKPIEMIVADTQNKPDIGLTVGGKWIDLEGVDVIVGGSSSSVSLAIANLVKDKNKVFLASDPATSDLTGKSCSANTLHWTYDTYSLAAGTGTAVTRAGGKTWYFVTADYTFGYTLEKDVESFVAANGGKTLGRVRHPLNTPDFSSFLLQAQASKAQVIGLANAGADTINAVKQAAEFGITQSGQKLAGLLIQIMDIHSLGLQAAQGLNFTEAFYWDQNEGTRAFSKRFAEKHRGRMPTSIHAGHYSQALHYLKAVQALGSDADGAKVVEKMKELPTDDPIFGKGSVRADGRKLHDMYLFEVKKPSESKGEWDYYKTVRTIPAAEAFRPMDQGDCPLVKKG